MSYITSIFLILALINSQPNQLQQGSTSSLQSTPTQTSSTDLQATQNASPQNIDQSTNLEIIGADSFLPKENNNPTLFIIAITLISSGVTLFIVTANKLKIIPKSIFVFSKKEDKVDKNGNQSNG